MFMTSYHVMNINSMHLVDVIVCNNMVMLKACKNVCKFLQYLWFLWLFMIYLWFILFYMHGRL